MFNNIIASESFTHFKTTYFFDFMQARNERKYIAITCSKKLDDGKYSRSSVQIFEDDFEFMLSALGSLFHHARRPLNRPTKRPMASKAGNLNRGPVKKCWNKGGRL